MKYLLAILGASFLSLNACAANTVTAVTNQLGSMTDVTIQTAGVNYKYSTCLNLTPYTYAWHVTDIADISTNADSSAWTLNDLTTAALALCIVKTTV